MKSFARDELTHSVIGKAMEIHRKLGPGLDEIFYHERLSSKLKALGIEHEFKPQGRLIHRGFVADEFEADIVVPHRLVLELKVLWENFAPDHFTQIICYQKFWHVEPGLLMDFGKESLRLKRIAYTPTQPQSLEPGTLASQAPAFISDKPLLGDLCERIVRIYHDYGLGYRDTTYRGLLFADLSADCVPCLNCPLVNVRMEDDTLGETKLNCLVVNNRSAILVVALRERLNAASRAVLQTYLRQLQLPWGLVVNFGKRDLHVTYVKSPVT